MGRDKMGGPVEVLYEETLHDAPAKLRRIADEIAADKYGEVGCVGVVLLGDTMEVFGFGPDSAAPSVALLLHAGFLRLSKALEEHGQ